MESRLKSPFPWFGGKSRAASLIWSRLGDVPNYVEPFFGSGAILLLRPDYDRFSHTETINDKDCYLANFWRALRDNPDAVAQWADNPVNEADLHARHRWLINQSDFQSRMKSDPDYYDAKIAGWWVWGLCCWIGSGWCSGVTAAKLPHLGNNGRGIHRQSRRDIYTYFEELADRLRRVRVCCGDWSRVLGSSVTCRFNNHDTTTGIVLDPPYDFLLRKSDLYAVESDVSALVRQWALENGDNPRLRIALCGYEDEHDMPHGWECVEWKVPKGYANNTNREKERVWFSPYCLKPEVKQQLTLFSGVA